MNNKGQASFIVYLEEKCRQEYFYFGECSPMGLEKILDFVSRKELDILLNEKGSPKYKVGKIELQLYKPQNRLHLILEKK